MQLAVTKLPARRLSAEVLCHTVPTMVLQGSPCATAPLSCHGGRRVAPTFIGIRTHEGRKPRNHPVRTTRLKGAFLRVFIEGEVPKSSNYVNPTIRRSQPAVTTGRDADVPDGDAAAAAAAPRRGAREKIGPNRFSPSEEI